MDRDECGAPVAAAWHPQPPELANDKEAIAWKREYNIRQREADWKRRQEEQLMQKQLAWQIEKVEKENRILAAQEARRREELERRVCQRHIELDHRYKDRLREVAIERRAEAWASQENARLAAISREAKEEAAAHNAAVAAEKAERYEAMRLDAAERAGRRQHEEALARRREERIREREEARRLKAAEEARRLKSDPAAKSKAVVQAFVDRMVPVCLDSVSDLTSKSVDPANSHFGASPGGIL